jgi:hypothetical protein
VLVGPLLADPVPVEAVGPLLADPVPVEAVGPLLADPVPAGALVHATTVVRMPPAITIANIVAANRLITRPPKVASPGSSTPVGALVVGRLRQ